MAIYKVINEDNETLNESGGAHQRLIKKRHDDLEKSEARHKRLSDLSDYLNHTSNSKMLKKKVDDEISKNENEYDRKRQIGGKSVRDAYETLKNSKKYGEAPEYRKDDIRKIKNSLGVGKSNIPDKKMAGLVKYFQSLKKNEAFDMCADYVVGCLEGSVDEFDLDLFTEASAFIIDCLDEDDE